MKPTMLLTDGNLGPDAVVDQVKKVGIPVVIMAPGGTLDSAQLLMAPRRAVPSRAEADSVVAHWEAAWRRRWRDTLARRAGRSRACCSCTSGRSATTISPSSGDDGRPDDALGRRRERDRLGRRHDAADARADRQGGARRDHRDRGRLRPTRQRRQVRPAAGISLTPAGKAKRIYRVDETEVMYFGPRTPASVRKIAGWLQRIHRDGGGRARTRLDGLVSAGLAGPTWRSVLLSALSRCVGVHRRVHVHPGADVRATWRRPPAGCRCRGRRAGPQRVPRAPAAARAAGRAHRRGARRVGHADAGTVSESDRRARAGRHVGRRGARRGARVRVRRAERRSRSRRRSARSPCRCWRSPARSRRRCSSIGCRSSFGKVNVFTLLLAGIAVNAVCGAGTGFLSYIARDPQARNITFWNLGTFTTADWRGVTLVARVLRALLRVVAAVRQGAQRADAGRGRGGVPRHRPAAADRPICSSSTR